MTDAPEEIWVARHEHGSIEAVDYGVSGTVKYIRADIAEAEYKRGMEDAARIADETGTCILPSGHFLSERVASAIRAQIQED